MSACSYSAMLSSGRKFSKASVWLKSSIPATPGVTPSPSIWDGTMSRPWAASAKSNVSDPEHIANRNPPLHDVLAEGLGDGQLQGADAGEAQRAGGRLRFLLLLLVPRRASVAAVELPVLAGEVLVVQVHPVVVGELAVEHVGVVDLVVRDLGVGQRQEHGVVPGQGLVGARRRRSWAPSPAAPPRCSPPATRPTRPPVSRRRARTRRPGRAARSGARRRRGPRTSRRARSAASRPGARGRARSRRRRRRASGPTGRRPWG